VGKRRWAVDLRSTVLLLLALLLELLRVFTRHSRRRRGSPVFGCGIFEVKLVPVAVLAMTDLISFCALSKCGVQCTCTCARRRAARRRVVMLSALRRCNGSGSAAPTEGRKDGSLGWAPVQNACALHVATAFCATRRGARC
jgi:hypothetical protein